jgi:O-antigen/teichoic acid export membrane protein
MEPNARPAGSLGVSAGMLAASQYVAAGLGFLTSILVARALGPAGYGAVTLLVAYPSLVWSVASAKSSLVTTRYISRFRAERRHDDLAGMCRLSYGIDILTSLSAVMIVAATAAWVSGAFYHLSAPSALMILYAAGIPVTALSSTSGAVLLSWGRFGTMAGFRIFGQAATLVSVAVALWCGLGVAGPGPRSAPRWLPPP